jgi:hypothetical protein
LSWDSDYRLCRRFYLKFQGSQKQGLGDIS